MVKQKLDIGFFTEMYSQINGTAHSVRFLSEAIAKYTGHNVHVFAPRIENGYKIPPSLHFHSFGGAQVSHKTGFALSFPLPKFFFTQHDYLDIAHIHTHAIYSSMAINWAKYLGIPMIGTHNSPLTYYTAQYIPIIGKALTKSDLLWRLERLLLNKYDMVHVATKSKKNLLLENKIKEPIVCMTNGIHDYYYQAVHENGIRQKYNIVGKKVLLYASRLSPEKNIISVIKSFKKIHDSVPDAHLLLVGSDGPSRDPAIRLIKKHDMKDYVSLVGRVSFEDLLKLYNTVDVTGLWSFVEAEGLVLIEAMAQGTPNVGANACGICDVIRHGETGYLANSLDEFNEYVIKLFKDESLRKEMGKNAKKIAQSYRLSKVANTWVEMYKFAIEEMYPLRYYQKERRLRVETMKNFIQTLPNVTF